MHNIEGGLSNDFLAPATHEKTMKTEEDLSVDELGGTPQNDAGCNQMLQKITMAVFSALGFFATLWVCFWPLPRAHDLRGIPTVFGRKLFSERLAFHDYMEFYCVLFAIVAVLFCGLLYLKSHFKKKKRCEIRIQEV